MEKISSLWYRILDEKPLPLLHSEARKRRLWFYQSLHLRLLNNLKVCEPEMCNLWSESFPLLHSCKSETSIASLGVYNGGNDECRNFAFFIQEQFVSQNNMLSLEEVISQTTPANYIEFHIGSG